MFRSWLTTLQAYGTVTTPMGSSVAIWAQWSYADLPHLRMQSVIFHRWIWPEWEVARWGKMKSNMVTKSPQPLLLVVKNHFQTFADSFHLLICFPPFFPIVIIFCSACLFWLGTLLIPAYVVLMQHFCGCSASLWTWVMAADPVPQDTLPLILLKESHSLQLSSSHMTTSPVAPLPPNDQHLSSWK